ncbi:hypothetical protein REB14_21310 [Chryseobacterium sp. ES2]|uniref:Ig-like domain-containing protein n=1 Tax=Chryseobacterium metallicongregator TaxID=3073042 RepID=A0ABU1EAM1_9FLAO|nr:hypothetical protein [Chryseobacterium sp. ES2]MDR4954727.1 hypothetical protein [Chryseobacterium sp. ES2]
MMKTISIVRCLLMAIGLFVSGKVISQEMVALPNGGCGRLLDTNTSSSSDGGFLCFRLGKEAANPNNMTDTDVNSFASLKPGTGAGLFCSMYVGVGTSGADFQANKPVYIDFASDGFNFNPSFNGGNFVFYNNGQEVYRTGINGHFFFDFGDNQERRIIKVIPTAAWDEVQLAFGEAIGIGFSFSQMRVYNILSEYYLAPMTYLSQPSDKTVAVGGSTTMTAVINNTPTDETPDNITYQWQVLIGSTWTDLANGSNYANVTSSTLSINNAPAGFHNNQYRVVANSSFHTCSFQAISTVGRLFVNSVNSPGTIAVDQTVCMDISNDPAAFGQTAAAQVSGAAEYQWQSSTDNITFSNITNATSATYDAPPITQTTYYRRGVRSVLNGNTTAYQYSNVVKVTVKQSCLIKCIITNRMIYTTLNSN